MYGRIAPATLLIGMVSGVDDDLLARLEIVFDYVSVEFGKYDALSADFLHDEAFTAKETGSDLLTEMHG